MLVFAREVGQPCDAPVLAPVVQRAEMTSRAPECVLAGGVQAGLKVRVITGPQKARVALTEEEP